MTVNETECFDIFPWNSNFETSIKLIDSQHRQLVEILNRLVKHLACVSDEPIIDHVFKELIDYTDYHFKTEEKIWAEHFSDDPWFQDHEKSHTTFIESIHTLKTNAQESNLDETIQDIVLFLTHWLAFHILDSDKRMATTVLALQEGASLTEAKRHCEEEMNGSTKVLINTVLTMYDNLSMRTLSLMREKSLRQKAEEALLHSEERWKFVVDDNRENVWDWNIENDELTHSSERVYLVDMVRDALSGGEHHARVHPDDLERVKADFLDHLDGKTAYYSNKHRVIHEDGTCSWILSRGKVVSRDEQGKALRMVGTHSDITNRELAALIFNNTSQAMMISDANNNIISVNPAFTQITGYTEEEVSGRNPSVVRSDKHDTAFYREMWSAVNDDGRWSGEIWNRRKNGNTYPQMLSINTIKDPQGNIEQYIALFSDISEKKKEEALIEKQANSDLLTELQNRRMFLVGLEQEISRSKRSGAAFALLFIDLDHFKEVNDGLGHEMGDLVLIEASRRIKEQIRASDIVSRFGGDEFTVILPEIKGTIGVEHTAQSIIRSLKRPFRVNSHEIYISASVGIALYPNDAADMNELLKNADQAMYQAKHSGRNRFNYFTASMQNSAQQRQHLLHDLHDALELGQFQLYYQPILDLKTEKIIKAEALIRWNHPVRGLVCPDDFVALAEQSGLIIEIGDWVFKEALQQTKKWQQYYDKNFKVSINNSPVQFRSSMDLNDWFGHMEALGLSSQNSVIEITESMLTESNSNIDDKLSRCRDAGFEIAIDDFGTGYSSLSYLKKFNVDYIKIDHSFIHNLSADSSDTALCKAMILMAHTLDIKVIAEGIETLQQREILTSMGCDYGQGYLFHKPMPAEAFESLLQAQ